MILIEFYVKLGDNYVLPIRDIEKHIGMMCNYFGHVMLFQSSHNE